MISNFHRFYFLGIVLDCAVPAMAQEQQDTTSRFNQVQQLNEVVVSSRSAKQRLNNVQIGQEKIQLSEIVDLKRCKYLKDSILFKKMLLSGFITSSFNRY